MATIDVIVWTYKAKRDGTYPLRLRITKDRKQFYKSLGLSIDLKYWDNARKKVKPGHPNSVRLNNFITKRLSEVQELILDTEIKNKNASAAKIKSRLTSGKNTDFFKFAELHNEKFNNLKSIGTYQARLAMLNKLKRFVKSTNLPFSSIDYEFLINYREYLKSLGNNPNTRTANLKKLREVYNEAARQGIVDKNDDPFSNLKMESNRTTKTKLTKEEIDRMRALNYDNGSINRHVRNIFLLCFNFMGMRIGDALTLKKKQIEAGRLTYAMKKTDDLISVKLTPEASRILAEYNLESLNGDDFIFPLVKNKKKSELHSAVKNATALYNQYLKDVAKDAKIEKHISSHVARHSWAQAARIKNVNISIIQQSLGHASSRTTEIYMEDFDSNVIDETNEMVVGN